MEVLAIGLFIDIALFTATNELILKRRYALVQRWKEGNITMEEIESLKRKKWFYYREKNRRAYAPYCKKTN